MKTKGYILAAVSAISYGMIPLFAIPLKQIQFPFDTALLYRFLISAIVIGMFLRLNKVDLRITVKEAGVLALLGLMYSGSSEFLFLGYDYMPAGVASTILFIYPVLVALIMGLGFKEKISWVVWTAIAMAFLGVSVLNKGEGGAKIPFIGFLVVLLSALSYGIYMVIVNKSRLKDMNGLKVAFYSMAFCTFFFLFKALASGTLVPIPSPEAATNLALFAVLTTVVSLITMVYAIQLIGSTRTAILGSMEPLTAVAVSVALFNEPFTNGLAAGIILILGAVFLTVTSNSITKHIKRPKSIRNNKHT